jgi:hypothetical protein
MEVDDLLVNGKNLVDVQKQSSKDLKVKKFDSTPDPAPLKKKYKEKASEAREDLKH